MQKVDPKYKANQHPILERVNDFLPIGLIVLGIGASYLDISAGHYFISVGFILYGVLELLLISNWSIKTSFKFVGKVALLILITSAGLYMSIKALNFLLVLPLILLDRFLFPRKENTGSNGD